LRTLLTFLPVIGCLLMMLVMCVPMMLKRNKGRSSAADDDSTPVPKDIAELRDEVSSLKAKLALQEGSDAGKAQ
jgi:hypothetical protein